jgi:hypothetical protein
LKETKEVENLVRSEKVCKEAACGPIYKAESKMCSPRGEKIVQR